MLRYGLLVLLVFAGATAVAEEVSYSFVQAGYQRVDFDVGGGSNVDGDGFGVGGSVAVGDTWHIVANYSTADFDLGVDLDEFSIGAGYHFGIAQNADFFAELLYVQLDASASGFSADDSGLGANVGLRSMISETLELFGHISHVDLDDAGNSTTVGAGLWYTVSGNLAVGLSASFDDDVKTYGIGLRLYFDQ